MSKKRNLFAGLICLVIAFVCLVSCVPVSVTPEQAAKTQAETDAQEVLGKIVWDDEDREAITSSLSFPTENRNYPGVHIEWETSEEDVIAKNGKVTLLYANDPRAYELNPEDDEDDTKVIKVIVTATVYADYTWEENGTQSASTDPISKQFEFTVFAMPEDTDQGTIKEVKDRAWNFFYVENEISKTLTTYDSKKYSVFVKGVVVGKLNGDTKGFFVNDGTDTIYVYGSNSSYQIGSKVQVFGQIYVYYGNLQIGSKVSTSFTTDVNVEPLEYERITPDKWNEQNKGLSDEVIGRFGGRALEVEGYLEEGKSAASDKYKLVDANTGVVSWVYYKSYDKNMEAELQKYVGKYVVLTGISYARDSRANANQLLWTGKIEETEAPVVSDETKANVILSQIALDATYKADFDLNDKGVWEVVSGTGVEIVDGVAKVTLANAKQTVVLKVTVTVGEAVASKEFTVEIPSLEINVTPLNKAAELATAAGDSYTAEKYYIEGVITEIVKEEYGNMYISDGVNTFYVYGVYVDGKKYGEAEVKPVVGQVVLLQGTLGAYKGTPQMKNADLIAYEYATDHATITNKVADQLGVANPNYTTEKYNIKGIVTEVKNTTYGNLYVKDLYGNSFYVYGVYSFDGSTRYDAMEKAPQVGDFVVLNGAVGAYNGAAQMKNAWLLQLNEENFVEAEAPKEPIQENQAYKLELVQPNAGKTVYFTGAMDGYYYATSEDSAAGVDVYAEKVDGGYNLYFLDSEGAKHYMSIVVSGEHVNAVFDNEEKTVFVYDEVYKTVVVALNDSVYTFGTRNDKSYTTIGANDLAKGTFVAYLVIEGEAPEHEHKYVDGKCECGETDPNYQPPVVEPVTELKEGQAYKFQLVQTKAGKTVYFTGAMSSYYYATSEDINAGVDVYVEVVEGGYNLYFLDKDGAKHYMGIVASGDHVNAVYDGEKTVFTYDAELKTVKAVVNDAEYVFGTRNDNTYLTIGANKVSYDPFYVTFVVVGEATEHEHKYVDGKCECGAEDPDYVKPSTGEYTIAEALELADGTAVIIKGTVDAVEAWNDQYGNMNFTLKDATGSLYVFRVYTKVALGDLVTVEGAMGSYYGDRQIAQGATITITGHDDSYDQVVEGTTTITFDATSKRTVFTTEQQVWVENGITVTNNKASSKSDVADYASPARFYASSQLIIESEKEFTKITFKTNSKNFSSDFTVEGATVTVNGTECVIEFAEAVTSFEIATLPYQVRVSYITLA